MKLDQDTVEAIGAYALGIVIVIALLTVAIYRDHTQTQLRMACFASANGNADVIKMCQK